MGPACSVIVYAEARCEGPVPCSHVCFKADIDLLTVLASLSFAPPNFGEDTDPIKVSAIDAAPFNRPV